MTTSNAINANSTGIVKYDGVGTFSATTTTNHNLLIGATSNAITNVAPSATSGIPVISQGSSSDPTFGTAVIAGGGTGSTTFNINGAVYSNTTTTGVLQAATLSSGQLLIGGTTTPAAATLTAGTGVSISNGNNSITVNAVGGGITWTTITGASQAMSVNNGYIANRAGTVAFTLPTTSAVGDMIAVTGINTATGWSIAYTTNQQIFFGSSTATVTTGTLASTAIRDTVYIVCVTANLTWNVVSSIGNITVT